METSLNFRISSCFKLRAFAFVTITTLLLLRSAPAEQTTWNSTTTDFNAGTGWSFGSPSGENVAVIVGAPGQQPSVTADISVSGILFAGAASGWNLTHSGGAVLTLTGRSTVGASGSADMNAAALRAENTSGTNTVSADLNLAPSTGPSTFFQSTGGTLAVSGVIAGTGIGLNVNGGGTVIFSGSNTYTGGTQVNAGTLLVNNSTGSGTGTGAVTVTGTGTTLGGTGSISGAVTVNANAKLQGGNGTTGTTLTLAGDLTLADNSIIQLALGPSLTHSTLAQTGSGTWTFDSNQAFTFIGSGATTGTYQDIITGIADPPSEGSWTITNGGWAGTFTYDGANIDLNLTAVPEPATWISGALVVGLIGWSLLKRRKAETLKCGKAEQSRLVRQTA